MVYLEQTKTINKGQNYAKQAAAHNVLKGVGRRANLSTPTPFN